MCKTYVAFDNSIKKILDLKKDPKVKEYLEAIKLLAEQKDDLKAQILE
jgi:hypothetical protein